ncbi:MAG TPA: TorF family putative porin, partial [Methylophilaceae bacterium]|nr:TorF family putative porin [Methylophilaceae bacterium]
QLKGCTMRKSILLIALLGAGFVTPGMALAEEAAAAPAAAEPASPHTVTYNVGLFSQYIWRGMTQTDEELALQGGIDYAHASGFYAGAWASNVNWTTDGGYQESNSIELDLYGGYANTIGETGIGYNVGVLQYLYPGSDVDGAPDTNATEVYGGLSYKWFNTKLSYAVSDEAWGFDDAEGSMYWEANADIPIGETGLTVNLHYGVFKFDGEFLGVDNDEYDYDDWKIGLTKAWSNGVKVGGYYTDNDSDDDFWLLKEQTEGQFTVFVQKLF